MSMLAVDVLVDIAAVVQKLQRSLGAVMGYMQVTGLC
jgi:hypothetical protein